MKTAKKLLQVFVASWVFASSLPAQEASQEMGKAIADEYCVQCHNVEVNGPFKLEPPSFAAIAKFRSKDQIKRRIIMPIHEGMPRYSNYMIGGNIDDMVAYITSLEN